MQRDFRELSHARFSDKKFLCVGLDSDIEKIPHSAHRESVEETLFAFNRAIIDATHDIAGFYKPNSAFYEAHGEAGWRALEKTVRYIRGVVPDTPVILDAKRADIGSTNSGYAAAAFDHLACDAITVHPYLGREALAPFLDRADKGVIVLCRTSNPGAGEMQDVSAEGEPLYLRVARMVAEKWNTHGNCGLVVGATYPEEAARIRAAAPSLPLLIPGIGAQGGDIAKIVSSAQDAHGRGMMINASRSILYASAEPDFASAAREKAMEHDADIRSAL